MVHACVTSSRVGLSYVHAHVVDASKVGSLETIEVGPLLRMVVVVETRPPVLKEVLRIRVTASGGEVQ